MRSASRSSFENEDKVKLHSRSRRSSIRKMPKNKEVGLDQVRRTNVTKLSSFIEVEGQRDVRELSNTSMQRRYVDQ